MWIKSKNADWREAVWTYSFSIFSLRKTVTHRRLRGNVLLFQKQKYKQPHTNFWLTVEAAQTVWRASCWTNYLAWKKMTKTIVPPFWCALIETEILVHNQKEQSQQDVAFLFLIALSFHINEWHVHPDSDWCFYCCCSINTTTVAGHLLIFDSKVQIVWKSHLFIFGHKNIKLLVHWFVASKLFKIIFKVKFGERKRSYLQLCYTLCVCCFQKSVLYQCLVIL